MTQEQFAEAIGKSWSFIAQLESTSKVTDVCLETLFKMADKMTVKRLIISYEKGTYKKSAMLMIFKLCFLA